MFHRAVFLVYYSNGVIYDILCFIFYASALLVYVRCRSCGDPISLPCVLLVCALYSLALGAKEMAVTLPVVLLLLEVILFDRQEASLYAWVKRLTTTATTAGMTAVYILGKLTSSDSLTNIPAYRPHLSPDVWAKALTWYTSQILCRDSQSASIALALCLWVVLLGAAVWLPSRLAGFGILMALIGLLPVSFIDLRQGNVW
jgi:hypothetical protein